MGTLMVKKLPEPFMSNNYKKTSPEFRTEKVIKKKMINCMSNGKDMIILFIVG